MSYSSKTNFSINPKGIRDGNKELTNHVFEGGDQNKFIISTFHLISGNDNEETINKKILLAKEAGFNLVELTFLPEDVLLSSTKIANTNNLSVIVQDLNGFSGFQNSIIPESDVVANARLEIFRRFPNVVGYFIWDEPFLEQIDRTKEIMNLIHKIDSGKILYTVALPSYGPYSWEDNAYVNYFDYFIKKIEPSILSFDYYPFRDNRNQNNLDKSGIWKDLGFVRKKALKNSKNFWFYYQGVPIGQNVSEQITIDKLRVQMYIGLAYGVKGLSCYIADGLIVDQNGQKMPLYEKVKDLNKEISQLGNILLRKESIAIYYTDSTEVFRDQNFFDDVSRSPIIRSVSGKVLIGVFQSENFDEQKYILVVNKDFMAPQGFKIKLRSPRKIEEIKTNKNTMNINGKTGQISGSLSAGQGKLFLVK